MCVCVYTYRYIYKQILYKDGEREDRDTEDRRHDEQASNVFEEEERIAEEGERAWDPLRRGSRSYHFLQH